MTLTEIVAREICDAEWGYGHYNSESMSDSERAAYKSQSDSVLAALRDPPAHVIEAGARALYVENGDTAEGYTAEDFDTMGDNSRQWWRARFLASWRAALNATENQ